MAELRLDIKANISKLKRDIKEALSQEFSFSGGAGGNKDVSNMSKAVSAGFAGAIAALGTIRATGIKLLNASPRLQKEIAILGQSMTLLLRPVGDLVAGIMRPFALAFLRFAVPFYKESLSNLNKTSGKIGGAVGAVGGAIAGGAGAAAAGAAISGIGGATAGAVGGAVAGPVGILIGALLGAITGALAGINLGPMLVTFFKDGIAGLKTIFTEDIPKFFTETLPAAAQVAWDFIAGFFTTTLPEVAGAALAGIVTFFTEDIPFAIGFAIGSIVGFFTDTLPEAAQVAWDAIVVFFTETMPNAVAEAFTATLNFFTKTLPESMAKAWEAVKKFLTETVPGWIIGGWDALKTFITETIPGWFSSLVESVKGLFNSLMDVVGKLWDKVKSFFSMGFGSGKEKGGPSKPKPVNDFIITKSGQVISTSPDDQIMGFKKGMPGGGGNVTVNNYVTVQALDVYSMQSTVLNDLFDRLSEKLKTELSGKTNQFPFVG